MEYPINNGRLQTISDELESYLDEKYIDNIVNTIKTKIITVAYVQCNKPKRPGETQAINFSKPGNLGMYDTILNKKLSIKVESLAIDPNNGVDKVMYSLYRRCTFKDLLPEIISKVQQLFPEMKISVDPLETYILFDWS